MTKSSFGLSEPNLRQRTPLKAATQKGRLSTNTRWSACTPRSASSSLERDFFANRRPISTTAQSERIGAILTASWIVSSSQADRCRGQPPACHHRCEASDKLLVLLTRRDVEAPNNKSERALRLLGNLPRSGERVPFGMGRQPRSESFTRSTRHRIGTRPSFSISPRSRPRSGFGVVSSFGP